MLLFSALEVTSIMFLSMFLSCFTGSHSNNLFGKCCKVGLDKLLSFAVINGRPLVQVSVEILKVRIGSNLLLGGPLVDYAALTAGASGALPKNIFLDQIFTQCHIKHDKLQSFFNHEGHIECTAAHQDLTAKFLADVKANPLTTLLTSYCVPLPVSSGIVQKSLLEQEMDEKLRTTVSQASADGDKSDAKLHQEAAKAKIDARIVKRSHAAAEETDASLASMFAEEATEAPKSSRAASDAVGPTPPKASKNGNGQKVAKHDSSGSSHESFCDTAAEDALTAAAIRKFGNLARAGFGESVIEGIRAFTVRMSDWDDVRYKSEEKVHL
jgi:hypothetical protein